MVYVSQRNTSIASYLSSIRELRKVTIRTIKKFPVSYRYSITNNMLQLAADAYTNALMADTIHLTKKTELRDYELRHRYLMIALSKINALSGEITFCYNLVGGEGNIAVTRLMRRKLRSFRQWVSAGRMAAEEVFQSYQSYRAHLKRCNSYRTLNRMDKFLVQLFKKELAIREKRFPCTLRAYTNNNRWVYICN